MQTNFSLAQLADPHVAEVNKILRACVHCGFCNATCPTYQLLGDELDGPRGRIYLMKEMFEREQRATAEVVKHIDRCLSCLACMTTCPSGVHYMHLVDQARPHIEKTYRRPLLDRGLRAILARTLPYPARFRRALVAGRLAKPFAALVSAVGMKRIGAMLRLTPWRARRSAYPPSGVVHAQGERRGRVALLTGCVDPVVMPQVRDSAIRLLSRHGIEVVLTAGETCCGSFSHHMGREEEALAFVRNNVDVWTRELEMRGLDAIVVTASGCGTTIKDYGFMLRTDPAYAIKAARLSSIARDLSEYLHRLDLPVPAQPRRLRVAYHSACSMQHGQKIVREPRELLDRMGLEVVDVPEGHLCCGSAGTYNMLQPQIAAQLRERKVKNIESVRPQIIATGNIGCMVQIGTGTDIPIVHTAELLDWATGGPWPAAISASALA